DIGQRIGLGNQLVDDPEKANDPLIAGRILAQFLKRSESKIRAALRDRDLIAARREVNGGSHGLNPFRTAYLRGQEVYAEDLQLAVCRRAGRPSAVLLGRAVGSSTGEALRARPSRRSRCDTGRRR